MTRDDLIQALADRIDVPSHSAQVFLHACFDIVKSLLREGEEITLPELGRWLPMRSTEGILTGVRYAALVPAGTDSPIEVLHGLASSIDARHFIPVQALDITGVNQRSPVDVATLVAEVSQQFAPRLAAETTSGNEAVLDRDTTPDALPPTPPVIDTAADHTGMQPISEADLLLEAEMEAEGYAVEADARLLEEDYPEDAQDVVEEDYPEDAQDVVEEDYPEDAQDAVEEDYPEDAQDAVEEDYPEDAQQFIGDDPILAQDAIPDVDPLSDEEVFHRNRDQLYNPPDEPSKRPLLITAAVLTLCVLVIIVYILLDHSAPRELPGSAPVGLRSMHAMTISHT
ncbi:MAG: HU family DNA-binding protein [Bacteroidetes bacterium]|nr:HU family DNA-binding protein [Bacteroidota bacterium]